MTGLPFPPPAKGEEEVLSEVEGPLLARFRPPMLRSYFAAAAARELAIREKRYPEKLAAGEMARDDAEADLAAWRAIATLFADGAAETDLSWAQLELATARALQRREDALAEKPADPDRIARRDAVWGIHERISWHRATVDDLNRRLRDRAVRTAQAA